MRRQPRLYHHPTLSPRFSLPSPNCFVDVKHFRPRNPRRTNYTRLPNGCPILAHIYVLVVQGMRHHTQRIYMSGLESWRGESTKHNVRPIKSDPTALKTKHPHRPRHKWDPLASRDVRHTPVWHREIDNIMFPPHTILSHRCSNIIARMNDR